MNKPIAMVSIIFISQLGGVPKLGVREANWRICRKAPNLLPIGGVVGGRPGRSLTNLLSILQIYIEKLRRPVFSSARTRYLYHGRQAIFQMLGVFADAGSARARTNWTMLGRRRVEPAVEAGNPRAESKRRLHAQDRPEARRR